MNTRQKGKGKKAGRAHRVTALQVSAQARYAVRILKDVADHQEDGLLTTEAAIAERQGISEKYLSRIVLPLRDAGLLSVRHGSRHGFGLLKPLGEITLLDVVETVQGHVTLLNCLGAAADCARRGDCFARRLWALANEGVRRCLASITLADADAAAISRTTHSAPRSRSR